MVHPNFMPIHNNPPAPNPPAQEPQKVGDSIPYENLNMNTIYYIELRNEGGGMHNEIPVHMDFIGKIRIKVNNIEILEDDERVLQVEEFANKELNAHNWGLQNRPEVWEIHRTLSGIYKEDLRDFTFYEANIPNGFFPPEFNLNGGKRRKFKTKCKSKRKSKKLSKRKSYKK